MPQPHSLALMCGFFSDLTMFAALVLLLILAKLIWENTIGSVGTAELIGSPVLVEAHLLGVIGGVLIALIYILWEYFFESTAD